MTAVSAQQGGQWKGAVTDGQQPGRAAHGAGWQPSDAAWVTAIAVVVGAPELNSTAGVVARAVTRRSNCTVTVAASPPARPPADTLIVTLVVDATLGTEGYNASFDGGSSVTVAGGDRMGVVYGAGATLRAMRYGPNGVTPPQPPPPPPPPVPVTNQWFPGETNQSYCYGQTQPDGGGTATVPLLGVFDTFDACKAACLAWRGPPGGNGTGNSSAQTLQCTACGWGDTPNLGVFRQRCYGRHDAVWQTGPVAVPGAVWARRYKLPLPTPSPTPPAPARPWSAADRPKTPGSFRGLYFATHFGNYFANAPPDEVLVYLEEMSLWGANTLVLICEAAKFSTIDPLLPLLDRNARIGARAHAAGFRVGWIFNNEGFASHPTNISYTRPAGDSGDFSPLQELVCPAKGLDYLLDTVWGPIMKRIRSNGLALDHLIAWPYDWGGCGCAVDWPWGSVGFPRFSSAVLAKARSEWGHGNARGTVSTWHFQMSKADEYGGLDKWLRSMPGAGGFTHAMSAVVGGWDWLEAHGPVGGLPTLDFPEYSMFGRCPWGGYGANPIPDAMQSDWDAHGRLIDGGMPYSEGIYLDINQVLRQRQYWSGVATADTLRDYAAFEFGQGAVDHVVAAVTVLEATYSGRVGSPQSQRALDLLDAAAAAMTPAALGAWRWRVLYLRALIDAAAYNKTQGVDVAGANATLQRSFAELDEIYHVERDCNGMPSGGARNASAGNCTIDALRPGFPESGAQAECSDERLKTDIALEGVSPVSQLPLFTWRYRDGFGLDTSTRFRGTTAQALIAAGRPDAVVDDGPVAGHFGVLYDRLPDVPFGPVSAAA